MRYVHQVIVVALLLVLISCDTSRSINPFEEDIGSYSVYGAIELYEEDNLIRIRDVSIPFLVDSGMGYDNIEVRLEEVESGREISIRDTVIDHNGNFTLNYLVEEDLQPRAAYNFSITNEFGEVVNSEFTMPGIGTHRINQNRVLDCWQPIRFTWDNVKAPEYILVEVGVDYQGQRFWGEVLRVDEPDHVPGADRMEMQMTVRQLLVDIFPPDAVVVPDPSLWAPTVECTELDNNEIYFRYIHFGPDWEQFEETEYYIFDFLDSGEVENGIGFLGGIRRDGFSFTVESMN